MKLGSFIKQPRERESYTINYAQDLTQGDNLQGATSSVEPAGLQIDQLDVFDPRVRFWVVGGEVGISYKVTITTTTSDGRILEDEVMIKIKDY
jgi:hypothetical protein